jgi:hypothetical protein
MICPLFFPEFQVNFNKESLQNTTYSFEYDYNSIMHYGQFYFRSDTGPSQ